MQLAFSGLFRSVEKNTRIITPTAALAAVGRRQYAGERILAGQTSWLTPPLVSQGAWLMSQWEEARYRSETVPTLLSRNQERLLWEEVVDDSEGLKLFDSHATAHLASRAARLMAEWEIPSQPEGWSANSDAAQFKRWLDLFRERCRREHWVTLGGLWNLLPEWIERGWCASEPSLFLLNGRPAPALSRLATSPGTRIACRTFERLNATPASISGHASATAEEELVFAARWARAAWEKNRSQSIAVFVADLASRPAAIARAFREVFYPGACRALTDGRLTQFLEAPLAYNLSTKPSLEARPLIASALQLLELLRDRLPVGLAGTILRSGWIKGAAAERNLRARADADLRRPRALDVSIDEVAAASARCPVLASIWLVVRRLRERAPAQTFDAWARCFGDLLAAFDWPGDCELQAEEQSELEAWRNALSELPALSLVRESASFEDALTQLKRLLGQRSRNTGSGLLAPVQILDWSDAPGLQFDAALITGLGEETWPPARRLMPFLPSGLQRRHEMPGSSQTALEAERQELLLALFGSAPNVNAAWAGRLSPNAQPFVSGSRERADAIWQGQTTWDAYKPALLDEADDTFAPAYALSSGVLGGTGIIKSQSHCPFQAFVKYRLHSRALEAARLGFDERERGGHLHRVLQFVWQRLGTSVALKAMSSDELKGLVAECAREAVRRPATSAFQKIVTAVELARLQEITLAWLALERQRLQPFAVEQTEAETSIELAGLELQLRVDRIDRLTNGGLILIDYKSGIQNTRKLDCPRPEEPQLLVYAASLAHEVQGIVFGQLKREDTRPVGLTRDPQFSVEGRKKMVETVGASWPERVAEWRDEVEHLAGQFKAGLAAVSPRRGACDFCEQNILCRVAEGATEDDPATE